MFKIEETLEEIKVLSKKIGNFLSSNFKKNKKIIEKSDRNLVTSIDTQAEEMIISFIKKRFPGHGILSEETPPLKGGDFTWIIDPLDGTHNFIRGIEIFGTSIALAYRGEIVLGVIHLPLQNQLYWALKDKGAYLNGVPIKVSGVKKLRQTSLSFDSSIRLKPRKMSQVLMRVAKECFNIRMLGSSVRVLSFIAQGALDACIEFNDFAWDCAAGKIIIEEAGGKFTYLDGSCWKINKRGYVASNGLVHSQLIKLINEKKSNLD